MREVKYIADYTVEDYQAGGEMVDRNIYKALNYEVIKSRDVVSYRYDHHYIVSNATMLNEKFKELLMDNGNYSIFEHDYKIHPTRQPHRYPNGVFPKNELVNLGFFRRARVVYLQSTDHLECYRANGIEANFVNLSTSIWDEAELRALQYLSFEAKRSTKFAIIGDTGPDKGQENAIGFCKMNTLDYEILPKVPQRQFYDVLSKYSTLVYFPNVRESFCRLVVEARCMRLNVITNKRYGAVKEQWYCDGMHGIELVEFLRKRTRENLDLIHANCQK